jgi:hypothetical protein
MSRIAQFWAHNMLGQIMEEIQQQSPPAEFPYDFPSAPKVLLIGQAIRMVQEVNLTIKQHNAEEYRRKDERWEAQIAQSKKPGGTVTLPDYEPNIIPWILKYKKLDPTGVSPGRAQLFVDFPTGRKRDQTSKMLDLVHSLFPPSTSREPAKAKEDPFERYMRQGGVPPTEGETGIDKVGGDT